ncbi:MAG: CHAP domain-containing protein [Bacteroidetes bacterium]|nr:CHAP domain-containing protein [Bacteroidota bacterium]
MTRKTKYILGICIVFILGYGAYRIILEISPNPKYSIGQVLDSLHGVKVYYNGNVGHVSERNTSADGYNIGLKYQCVEFVKRYYYEYYHHKMPDSYGNAKDFFNAALSDGAFNKARGLLQYRNPSHAKPREGDLVILDGHVANPYGHVAIVAGVSGNRVEIIQQNPGAFGDSRVTFELDSTASGFYIQNDRLLGWLRKDTTLKLN